jgi:hypothetical protein
MRKRYLDALIAAVVPALATLGAFTDGPSGKRMDAGETAFFARELESIKVQIVEAEYPTLLARQVIPMGSGVDPGADTYTWREFDRSGLAKVISNYATDIPDVEEQGKENKSSIESIGIGFSYSIQDIRAAAKVGRPLQARKAMLAREEAERTIDDILALGDSTRGVPGFLKTTGVPLLTVGVNGSWLTSATAAEMLADLRLMEFTVWKQSKKRHKPDTLLLGLDQYAKIASTPVNELRPEITVLDAFLASSTSIKTVEAWEKCDGAAANNTSTRAVAYEKSNSNMEAFVPVEYESFPPQAKGLMFSVPGHARVGGTVVYRPLSMVYCDVLS